MDSEHSLNVVIVGGGVIALTSALQLVESKTSRYSITVVAEHLPGDESPLYTSPWAGANYLPMATEGTRMQRWERDTGPRLWALADSVPAAGVHATPVTLLNRDKDREGDAKWARGLHSTHPWFIDCVRDFKALSGEQLSADFDDGNTFTSLCINVPVYLCWLQRQLAAKGVCFVRTRIQHICEAAQMHAHGRTDVVVNCTGFQASTLGGAEDRSVFPARGQICLVRNKVARLVTTSGTDDGDCEIILSEFRVTSSGLTVLGGTYEKHSNVTSINVDQAERIMKRCVALCPELTDGKGIEALDVVQHTVGLRPVRDDGPRVEAETINGVKIVHCYGHGGYGYQTSYGCAIDVEALILRSTAETNV